MDEFLTGAIVAFGPASNERIGIVSGRVQHHRHGDSYLVRTPLAIIKDQLGDLAPVAFGVRSATVEQFRMHAEAEIASLQAQLSSAIAAAELHAPVKA